jgi:hypothetical protein
MKKRILLTLGALVLFVVVVSIYLAARTAVDLLSARQALRGAVQDLEAGEIAEARDAVASASDRLDGVLATTVGIVPVVGQNLRALEAVADGAFPVLESAYELRQTADEIDEQDLVANGRVRLELIERMRGPLEDEAEALESLGSQLREARSGLLLPPVHDEISELIDRVEDLRSSAAKASAASGLAPDMLGRDEPRTYLVLLINNVELRGAGGILSGLGTVTMSDGGIQLGDFFPYAKLGSNPYKPVQAPPGFVERFGFAQAHTTLFINTTYSPEVPDVALVAARLFEKVKNIATDGAIVVDPRGVAALMPPGAEVDAPSGGELDAKELPDYIYATAYEELGGPRDARRAALLDVGRNAFQVLAERGPGGVEDLGGLAEAVAAGHLRFVSFDDVEAELLANVGASGALPEAQDSVFVTVQNQGADKLDYYIRRRIEHRCAIENDEALCETRATLRNEAPDGLTPYVSPRARNEAIEFLEVYVPGNANVTSVELDGSPAEFLRATQGDRTSYGTDIRIDSGERATLGVTYTLPLDGSYELTVTPQPLTHDAEVRVELDAPRDWTINVGGESEDERIIYEKTLTSTLTFTAKPSESSGLTSIWEAASDFWSEQLF